MKLNRKTVILLLDDPHGINEIAFNDMMLDIPNDVLDSIQTANGRYFLNESDAERLMEVDTQKQEDEAEQQRRDEKNGLYPDKVDVAN